MSLEQKDGESFVLTWSGKMTTFTILSAVRAFSQVSDSKTFSGLSMEKRIKPHVHGKANANT
jgi:hypothetical protein